MAEGWIGPTGSESDTNPMYSRHSQASLNTMFLSNAGAGDQQVRDRFATYILALHSRRHFVHFTHIVTRRVCGIFYNGTSITENNNSHARENQVESLSLEMCTIMTKLGYGEAIRRRRVEKYKETDRLLNARQSVFTWITAGSKGEGLTCSLESDMDLLSVVNGVLCVEAGINFDTIPGDIDLFRMDTRVYPGHCKLLQMRQRQNCLQDIRNALCDNGYGGILLSSCLWVDALWANQTRLPRQVRHERAGPSTPLTFRGVLDADIVVGLRCQCPSILQKWAARPRKWPPQGIVQKVVSLGAYVTPVGVKGSEFNHMEWRICFNTGEAELVNSLNDTQVKVYVMLKMILKELFKPNNKEITSYVLKNIILWQAENNQQAKFHARSLFYWLHDGLSELRTAIQKKKQLRYYMIPERNLMTCCGLNDALQSKWVADITEIMAEGPLVIMRLDKIRKAFIASPEPLLWFSKKRMKLEMLGFELINRRRQCDNENRVHDSDFIMKALQRRLGEVMGEVRLRMQKYKGSVVKNIRMKVGALHVYHGYIDSNSFASKMQSAVKWHIDG